MRFLFVICIIGLFMLSSIKVWSQKKSDCITINFEAIPNDSIYEGLAIDSQFYSSVGVLFSLEDGRIPLISKVGDPMTAFGGPPSHEGPDMPAPNQGIGDFFLTDDGVVSSDITSPPLLVRFSNPADSVSGVILDVDLTENYVIQARNQTDSVLVETIISSGDPNTGDGIASTWSIVVDKAEIYSLRIVGGRSQAGGFGLGFDNFTSCIVDRTTNTLNVGTDSELKIFPNPSISGKFSISVEDEIITAIEVISIDGRKTKSTYEITNLGVDVFCDFIGVAIVYINTSNGLYIKKVVLNK